MLLTLKIFFVLLIIFIFNFIISFLFYYNQVTSFNNKVDNNQTNIFQNIQIDNILPKIENENKNKNYENENENEIIFKNNKITNNYPDHMYTIEFLPNQVATGAYYDDRYNIIRVLVVSELKYISEIKCNLKYNNGVITDCNIYVEKPKSKKKRYHSYNINITIPNDIPNTVIFNGYSIPVSYTPDQKILYNCTLCIAVMVNYTAAYRVIQTFESNRNFGVDHIIVYKTTTSREVDKVLNYYVDEGFVEIITWNATHELYVEQAPHFGHVSKLNDCFYRMFHSTKSIIVTDLDEILWPIKGNTLPEMFKNLDGGVRDIYYFDQRLYHTQVVPLNATRKTIVYDADLFIYQEYCELRRGIMTKQYINNVLKFTHVDMHLSYGKKFGIGSVPLDYGYVRHTTTIRNMYGCVGTFILANHDEKEISIQNQTKNIQSKLKLKLDLKDDAVVLGPITMPLE